MENFIKQIIKKAGDKTLKLFGKVGVKYTKSHASDVVTEADLLSHRFIVAAIQKKYPRHGIISEEDPNLNNKGEYLWIVDPLDGTLNFSRNTPLYGVMIALVHNDKVEMSAIYLPYFKELFFAKRNKGAFLNGRRIHCSKFKEWAYSFGTGPTSIHSKSFLLKNFLKSVPKERIHFHGFGSVAVDTSYVITGRRDWIASTAGGVWDLAAPSLLLQESGCRITNFNGKSWKLSDMNLAAANPTLHKKLLKVIHPVRVYKNK